MSEIASDKPAVNDKREIRGWAMYDWANSAFSTTVGTVFLGPYVANLAREAAQAVGTDTIPFLGIPVAPDSFFPYCISFSVGAQVLFLPILGAIADYSHRRKQMMQLFATIGALATVLLFLVTGGLWWLGGVLYIVANLAFGAAAVFYNSYLPDIASEDRRDRVSSFGWAMGYLGGGLLLVLNLAFYMFREKLGVPTGLAIRINLASAGLWWLGFSFFTWARLRARHAVKKLPAGETYLRAGFKQLGHTLQEIRNFPETLRFLLAYFLYNDGIQTVIAVSATFAAAPLVQGGLELDQSTLTIVILMIQFVAFGGALFWGLLAAGGEINFNYPVRILATYFLLQENPDTFLNMYIVRPFLQALNKIRVKVRGIGAKNAILVSLVIWAGVTIYAYGGMKGDTRVTEFFVLGFFIALVMGGSQAISRSLFAQMIPEGKEAEYYSFYEVSERGTSWIGPFLFGVMNQAFNNLRPAILSLIFFFVMGLVLLPIVNVKKAIEDVKQYQEA